jgi:hypothetical protein
MVQVSKVRRYVSLVGSSRSLYLQRQSMKRFIQFRMRTILFLVTAASCFFAWRQYDPERKIVLALEKAGGCIHRHDEFLNLSIGYVNLGMLADYEYFSMVRVLHRDDASSAKPTITELILGRSKGKQAAVIEFQLEQMTPAVIDDLKRLKSLRSIIVHMPASMLRKDSEEVKAFKAIRDKFDEPVYSTFIDGGAFGLRKLK